MHAMAGAEIQVSPILFDHRRIRLGGTVKRFHTWPTIKEQTVAAHTWGVLAILYAICKPSSDLVRRAVFHDVVEYDTGDIPSTFKWAFPDVKILLDEVEKAIEERLGLDLPELSKEEQDLLKFADLCEMLWWAYEERCLGNLNADIVFTRVVRVINDRFFKSTVPPHLIQAQQMLTQVTNDYPKGNYVH